MESRSSTLTNPILLIIIFYSELAGCGLVLDDIPEGDEEESEPEDDYSLQ